MHGGAVDPRAKQSHARLGTVATHLFFEATIASKVGGSAGMRGEPARVTVGRAAMTVGAKAAAAVGTMAIKEIDISARFYAKDTCTMRICF